MIIKKFIFLLFTFQVLSATSLEEDFKQKGYLEICDRKPVSFDALYSYFDNLIDFFQKNPSWAQKLYGAKERFIRSKDRNLYSTDFFGFYHESHQISFYYSSHFHEFISSHYPEFNGVPEISCFFEACLAIQKPCTHLFEETAAELSLEMIFPILVKVVKYLPSYMATRPHYDGSAFSLFLDSTDNQSLLLAPYKSLLTVDDFSPPVREFQNSILLIPGALLTEFSIYPTPHIVSGSGKIRYAAIAFAMRPNGSSQKNALSLLPTFTPVIPQCSNF